MEIRIDDLSGREIRDLLAAHLAHMRSLGPRESTHVLPIDQLREPGITFWSVWENDELLGCGALKELDTQHGEIKSMRTAVAHMRKGVASAVLQHVLVEARRRGYRRVSLETGAKEPFWPAQRLYRRAGFEYCGPFADYVLDPNSVFMTKVL